MYRGKLVRLREYTKNDIFLIKEYVNDPEVKLYTAPNTPYLFTLEDEERWYESNSANNDHYSFIIETLDTQEVLGACGVNAVDWKNRNATIGIFIGDHSYWNKGFGTDALKVLIAFIFNEMNLHKIKLCVYDFNERAIHCYKKLGFKTDGVLRDEVFKQGSYHDEILMSLLRSEFKAQEK